MHDDTVFHQSETHTASDLRRAKELRVVTALTVTGEAAVLLYGKGYRLLLLADQALRVTRDIVNHLAEASAISTTRYTTYSLEEQESHGTDQQQ